jgi:acetolactate synthase-1/2/3 large subunit
MGTADPAAIGERRPIAQDDAAAPATGAELLLESLRDHGVDCIFANLGTDYAPIVEALARFRQRGVEMPRVVLCQHEAVALSAAHGYAAATGRPQAVFVHADVGTQNLGGALHNAFRARAPVLIVAGLSPITTRGELVGSRSAPVQYLQDVPDQASIVRQYVKWASELRTAVNVRQVVARALQVASAEPCGVVYLAAPREPLEQFVERPTEQAPLAPPQPTVPVDESLETLRRWLHDADLPLVLTSYLGRSATAAAALVELAETAGLGVADAPPFSWSNFPTSHPQYLGAAVPSLVAAADVLLLVDVDTPWVPALTQPRPGARIAHLDIDPVKATMPLCDVPAQLLMPGTSGAALRRLLELVRADPPAAAVLDRRRSRLHELHAHWRAEAGEEAARAADRGVLTPALVAQAVDEALGDRGIVLHEAVSNAPQVIPQIRRGGGRRLYGSGGGSLGWGGGAALGIKLALPQEDVVYLTGDGTFVFTNPTAVYWGCRRYRAPFMTVILNNVGWRAVKAATLQQHPDGAARDLGYYAAGFEPGADLIRVAQSAGAHAETVTTAGQLERAVAAGLAATQAGVASVIDVRLDQRSE